MVRNFKTADDLDKAAEGKDLSWGVSDSSCTSGYDNDGSTGFEIFRNGFELARKAGDREIWLVEQDACPPIFFFFVGTHDEVLAKIQSANNEE